MNFAICSQGSRIDCRILVVGVVAFRHSLVLLWALQGRGCRTSTSTTFLRFFSTQKLQRSTQTRRRSSILCFCSLRTPSSPVKLTRLMRLLQNVGITARQAPVITGHFASTRRSSTQERVMQKMRRTGKGYDLIFQEPKEVRVYRRKYLTKLFTPRLQTMR